MAELFTRWVADGTADRLARGQRQEAAARQALAREILGHRTYYAEPASYHLWLPLPPPWRAAEFVAALRERGVLVDSGSTFAVERAKAPHAIRVSLSAAADRARLRGALKVLAATLDETPPRRREVI